MPLLAVGTHCFSHCSTLNLNPRPSTLNSNASRTPSGQIISAVILSMLSVLLRRQRVLRTSVCGLESVMEEPCSAAPSAAPADSRPTPLHAAQSKRTTPEHSLHEIQITPRRDRGRPFALRAEQANARTEPHRDCGRTSARRCPTLCTARLHMCSQSCCRWPEAGMGGRWALTTLRWQAFFLTWSEYQLSAEFHASEQILTTCQTHTAAALVLSC